MPRLAIPAQAVWHRRLHRSRTRMSVRSRHRQQLQSPSDRAGDKELTAHTTPRLDIRLLSPSPNPAPLMYSSANKSRLAFDCNVVRPRPRPPSRIERHFLTVATQRSPISDEPHPAWSLCAIPQPAVHAVRAPLRRSPFHKSALAAPDPPDSLSRYRRPHSRAARLPQRRTDTGRAPNARRVDHRRRKPNPEQQSQSIAPQAHGSPSTQ